MIIYHSIMIITIVIFMELFLILQIKSDKIDNSSLKVLSRPRRFIYFPEGSTFSFAYCMTLKTITLDKDIFSESVAVAVSYDMPSNTTTLGLPYPFHRATRARRDRRQLYSKVENILDTLGIDGKQCVLRAVCEAAQQLAPGDGIFTEILRIILMFPAGGTEGYEEEGGDWSYLGSYKAGLRNNNCQDLYFRCPYSFVSMAQQLIQVHHH